MQHFLVSFLLITSGDLTSSPSVECERFMQLHGYLSRARSQCGFSRYNQTIVAQAGECSARMGRLRAREVLQSGASLFDREEARFGHDATCADVLQQFSDAIGR